MRQVRRLVAAVLGLALAHAQAQTPPAQAERALVQVEEGEQPIRLAHAGVDVYVEGSLVHTVVDLTLSNPNSRVLQGELRFPLHAGQTVSGFALDMADGSMRAAVPLPKARAREVFEDVVRRGVDPALLEQTAGENFKLSVYPLRPGGSRHVHLALTEWLTPDAQQRLRLGLPLDFAGTPAEQFDLHVRLHATAPGGVRLGGALDGAAIVANGGDSDVTLHREAFRPKAEGADALDIRWAAVAGDTVMRERVDGQGYFHAEVQLPDQPAERARPDEVTVTWDASGSRARADHDAELRVLAGVFAWVPDVKVRLRVVRDAAEPDRLFDVRHGDWQALRDAIKAIAYDGASNASLWAARGSRNGLALLFSDGLGNWGAPVAVAAPAAGELTAFAVMAGSGGSAVFLRQWAEARGGRLLDLQALSAEDALRQLCARGTRLLRIDGEGFDEAAVASWRPDAGRLVLAGRITAPAARLDLVLEAADGSVRHKLVDVAAPPQSDNADAGFVAQRWARLRVDQLLAQPELHRAEIVALGNRFGIVTPETSLLVLEALDDYEKYDIVPPAGPLRQAFEARKRSNDKARAERSATQLARLVRRFEDIQAWWDKNFPKDVPAKVSGKGVVAISAEDVGRLPERNAGAAMNRLMPVPVPAPAPSPSPSLAFSADAAKASAANQPEPVMVTGARASRKERRSRAEEHGDIQIAVQAWTPDAAGTRRLSQASAADRYAVYLDQRQAAADSPAFYLDAAQVFARHGQKALALRVLSNLAELHLEDRGLLRVLAYRLQDIGETAQAVRLLQHVAELAPDEPQSWRDLGLAQATAGEWQPAVDALWQAASGTWDSRFGDIDMISLQELDAIAALHKVDLSAVDGRLRRNLPLDVRVALAWDTDDTDIDLWVKDPHGEWVSYENKLSRQGGRNTADVTQGYGPEVFSLKKAVPGVYEVHARYFGSHRQVLGNTTQVMMRLTTGFGTPAEKHRDVILRLQEAKDDLLVGTFEVKP